MCVWQRAGLNRRQRQPNFTFRAITTLALRLVCRLHPIQGDLLNPTVPVITRQPAAIIADCRQYPSPNRGLDALARDVPNATNTTIKRWNHFRHRSVWQTGYYSGGVENFPRFLENWSGNTSTYYAQCSSSTIVNKLSGIGAQPTSTARLTCMYFRHELPVPKPAPGVMCLLRLHSLSPGICSKSPKRRVLGSKSLEARGRESAFSSSGRQMLVRPRPMQNKEATAERRVEAYQSPPLRATSRARSCVVAQICEGLLTLH
jgi:hypothetical protein